MVYVNRMILFGREMQDIWSGVGCGCVTRFDGL